jgi:hypothetical protein
MPTAIPSASIPANIASSKSTSSRSDFNELVPILLFSGIGLLASLIAVLWGVLGAWF